MDRAVRAKETDNAWKITAYLKGIAIIAVMVAHYGLYFDKDAYFAYLQGYANGFVTIFFVVGGYGIFYSLERRTGGAAGILKGWRPLLAFYLDRALRILPLYWTALLVTPFFFPEFATLHSFSFRTLAIYAGFPFVRAPGLFWFVTAIIQCYLAAPLLYAALKKFGAGRFFIYTMMAVSYCTAATLVIFVFRPSVINQPSPLVASLFYKDRDFLLAHLLLFALGMLIPTLLQLYGRRLKRRSCLAFSLAVFLLSLYCTRFQDMLFFNSFVIMMPLLILSAFAICLLTLAVNPPLPFAGAMAFIGSRSYPQYLFHMGFFGAMAGVGLIGAGARWPGAAVILLVYPFFLAFCALVQAGDRYLERRVHLSVAGRTPL